jgi:hypothetical protein
MKILYYWRSMTFGCWSPILWRASGRGWRSSAAARTGHALLPLVGASGRSASRCARWRRGPGLTARITEETGGIPLLVIKLARDLRDAGGLMLVDGR